MKSTDTQQTSRPIRVSFAWSRFILKVFGVAYDIDAPTLDGHPWKSHLYDAYSICIISAFSSVAVFQCVSIYNSFGNFQRQLDGAYTLVHALAKISYAILFFTHRKKFYALISKTKRVYPNEILVKYNFKMDYKIYRTLGLAFVVLGSIACFQWALTPLVDDSSTTETRHVTSPVFGTFYPFDADLHPQRKLLFDVHETAALFYDSIVGFAFYGVLYSLISHLCAGIQSLKDNLARVDAKKREFVPKKRRPGNEPLDKTSIWSIAPISKSAKSGNDLNFEQSASGSECSIVVDPLVKTMRPVLYALEVAVTGDSAHENEFVVTLVTEEEEHDEEVALEVNQMLVERALLGCIRQHQAIVKFAVELSQLLHPILLIQSYVFKSAFSILAIQVVVHTHDVEKQLKFYSTFLVYSIMLYMYCWIGDTLREKSRGVADVAYACNWYDWSTTSKSNLRLLMLRAQRPLQLMAGKLFPISLHMCLTIINTSYSIFDILRRLNDKFKIYEGSND